MLQIDNTLISFDVFDKTFVCQLHACKGNCCVEGDSGAPLDENETIILDEIYPKVEPYMTPEGINSVKEQGTWVVDSDGDLVTPLVHKKECVYVFRNSEGIVQCAIEKAFNEGKIGFQKPISCHLFPVRLTKYPEFVAVNYERNPLCVPARILGEKTGIPMYQFLKTPLIRKFGSEWYHQIEIAAKEFPFNK